MGDNANFYIKSKHRARRRVVVCQSFPYFQEAATLLNITENKRLTDIGLIEWLGLYIK